MTIAAIGHNNPPPPDPFELINDEIQDLFQTAKDFCDGEPIASQEMHDTIEKIHDQLHDAGKRAEAMRVAEKKPLDEAVAAVQEKWNPLVQPKKGRVSLGKDACASLLTPWRNRIAAEKEAAARLARQEADRIAAEAQAAIRTSAGNLEEREKAEDLLRESKQVERFAKRADREATTGTGLRSVWHADLVDVEAGLDWAYGLAPTRFKALVQQMADEAVRQGARSVPGFVVREERVAA